MYNLLPYRCRWHGTAQFDYLDRLGECHQRTREITLPHLAGSRNRLAVSGSPWRECHQRGASAAEVAANLPHLMIPLSGRLQVIYSPLHYDDLSCHCRRYEKITARTMIGSLENSGYLKHCNKKYNTLAG